MGSHRVGHDCSDLAAAAAAVLLVALPYNPFLLDSTVIPLQRKVLGDVFENSRGGSWRVTSHSPVRVETPHSTRWGLAAFQREVG